MCAVLAVLRTLASVDDGRGRVNQHAVQRVAVDACTVAHDDRPALKNVDAVRAVLVNRAVRDRGGCRVDRHTVHAVPGHRTALNCARCVAEHVHAVRRVRSGGRILQRPGSGFDPHPVSAVAGQRGAVSRGRIGSLDHVDAVTHVARTRSTVDDHRRILNPHAVGQVAVDGGGLQRSGGFVDQVHAGDPISCRGRRRHRHCSSVQQQTGAAVVRQRRPVSNGCGRAVHHLHAVAALAADRRAIDGNGALLVNDNPCSRVVDDETGFDRSLRQPVQDARSLMPADRRADDVEVRSLRFDPHAEVVLDLGRSFQGEGCVPHKNAAVPIAGDHRRNRPIEKLDLGVPVDNDSVPSVVGELRSLDRGDRILNPYPAGTIQRDERVDQLDFRERRIAGIPDELDAPRLVVRHGGVFEREVVSAQTRARILLNDTVHDLDVVAIAHADADRAALNGEIPDDHVTAVDQLDHRFRVALALDDRVPAESEFALDGDPPRTADRDRVANRPLVVHDNRVSPFRVLDGIFNGSIVIGHMNLVRDDSQREDCDQCE